MKDPKRKPVQDVACVEGKHREPILVSEDTKQRHFRCPDCGHDYYLGLPGSVTKGGK